MSEEKPDYKPIPIGSPYPEELEDLDPERYEGNRAAWRLARATDEHDRAYAELRTPYGIQWKVNNKFDETLKEYNAALKAFRKLRPERE